MELAQAYLFFARSVWFLSQLVLVACQLEVIVTTPAPFNVLGWYKSQRTVPDSMIQMQHLTSTVACSEAGKI